MNKQKNINMEDKEMEVKRSIQDKIDSGEACKYCGMDIIQFATGRRKKFCSVECRRAWWAEHPEMSKKNPKSIYRKKCLHCGKRFKVYGNKNRKFCSHDCYIKNRFW